MKATFYFSVAVVVNLPGVDTLDEASQQAEYVTDKIKVEGKDVVDFWIDLSEVEEGDDLAGE
jgi:hypothetical protein